MSTNRLIGCPVHHFCQNMELQIPFQSLFSAIFASKLTPLSPNTVHPTRALATRATLTAACRWALYRSVFARSTCLSGGLLAPRSRQRSRSEEVRVWLHVFDFDSRLSQFSELHQSRGSLGSSAARQSASRYRHRLWRLFMSRWAPVL